MKPADVPRAKLLLEAMDELDLFEGTLEDETDDAPKDGYNECGFFMGVIDRCDAGHEYRGQTITIDVPTARILCADLRALIMRRLEEMGVRPEGAAA